MYILTVTYPATPGATFDHDYYRETHLPKAGEAFAPFGCGYASVLVGEAGVEGFPPNFLVFETFSFQTEEGAKAAVNSDLAKELMADIANFTNVAPLLQFSKALP